MAALPVAPEQIWCFVTFTPKADKKHDFLQAIKDLQAHSKKEAGNVVYELSKVEGKSEDYTLFEVWKNQAAFDFHSKTKHFVEGIHKLQETADVKLVKANPVKL